MHLRLVLTLFPTSTTTSQQVSKCEGVRMHEWADGKCLTSSYALQFAPGWMDRIGSDEGEAAFIPLLTLTLPSIPLPCITRLLHPLLVLGN